MMNQKITQKSVFLTLIVSTVILLLVESTLIFLVAPSKWDIGFARWISILATLQWYVAFLVGYLYFWKNNVIFRSITTIHIIGRIFFWGSFFYVSYIILGILVEKL